MGVSQVATQADRECLLWAAVADRSAHDLFSNPKVPAAVRHGRDLSQNALGLAEGFVNDPQRASAANPGEVEVGGGVALRDVARAIHTNQKERQALCARPLQRRQAMAYRLEADR